MRDKRTPKDVCGEASIASVSARVRRDIWDEIFFFLLPLSQLVYNSTGNACYAGYGATDSATHARWTH